MTHSIRVWIDRVEEVLFNKINSLLDIYNEKVPKPIRFCIALILSPILFVILMGLLIVFIPMGVLYEEYKNFK